MALHFPCLRQGTVAGIRTLYLSLNAIGVRKPSPGSLRGGASERRVGGIVAWFRGAVERNSGDELYLVNLFLYLAIPGALKDYTVEGVPLKSNGRCETYRDLSTLRLPLAFGRCKVSRRSAG